MYVMAAAVMAASAAQVRYQGQSGVAGIIRATSNHPFFVAERGGFVAAADLDPGSWLIGPEGLARVDEVRAVGMWAEPEVETVYGLSIDIEGTYLVDGGAGPVLVHNDCKAYQALIRTTPVREPDRVAAVLARVRPQQNRLRVQAREDRSVNKGWSAASPGRSSGVCKERSDPGT